MVVVIVIVVFVFVALVAQQFVYLSQAAAVKIS